MSAISGTRRALKELVDGTIRVQIDIDPQFKAQFHEMFPNIDMPVALAPLVSDFERKEEKPKGGALCKLAAMWCKDEKFWEWIFERHGVQCDNEQEAASWMRDCIGITSRSEIDGEAAASFQNLIRVPFMNWMERK